MRSHRSKTSLQFGVVMLRLGVMPETDVEPEVLKFMEENNYRGSKETRA